MTVQEIRMIARERGIKTGKMTKGELIRSIQLEEGNRDCFGETPAAGCTETHCLWHADCQP